MKTAGVAGLGSTLVSSTSAVAAAGDVDRSEYDTVVNVVDAGADPTGEESIDSLLTEHMADDTLIYFPEGEYKIGQFRNYTGDEGSFDVDEYVRLENFGIEGAGSDEVSLVARQGAGSGDDFFETLWFELRYGREYHVQGLTFDFTAEGTGGRFQIHSTGDFEMRDVTVEGVCDGPDTALSFSVAEEDAHGMVQNVQARDGGAASDPNVAGPVGIFVFPYSSSLNLGHRGTLTLRDCRVENFPNNGVYASSPPEQAAVHVEGGYYANNNIAQVRLGTPNSYVKNARVEVNEVPDFDYTTNMRGIRVSDGSGVTIKNCDVVYTAAAPTSGAIVGAGDGGAFSIKNTGVRVDDPFSGAAVVGKSADFDDDHVEMKNVSVTGDASGGAAVVLTDRNSNVLKNVCIDQTGDDRDGIECINSDSSVANAQIDVTGEAIVAEESDVSTRNVRYTANCSPTKSE